MKFENKMNKCVSKKLPLVYLFPTCGRNSSLYVGKKQRSLKTQIPDDETDDAGEDETQPQFNLVKWHRACNNFRLMNTKGKCRKPHLNLANASINRSAFVYNVHNDGLSSFVRSFSFLLRMNFIQIMQYLVWRDGQVTLFLSNVKASNSFDFMTSFINNSLKLISFRNISENELSIKRTIHDKSLRCKIMSFDVDSRGLFKVLNASLPFPPKTQCTFAILVYDVAYVYILVICIAEPSRWALSVGSAFVVWR